MANSGNELQAWIRLGKTFSIPTVIVATLAVALYFVWYPIYPRAADHSMYICEEKEFQFSRETYVAFGTADRTSSNRLTIATAKRDILVHAGRIKGVIDWKDIRSVRYHVEAETTGVLEIEYEGPRRSPYKENFEDVSFGILPQDCWE